MFSSLASWMLASANLSFGARAELWRFEITGGRLLCVEPGQILASIALHAIRRGMLCGPHWEPV